MGIKPWLLEKLRLLPTWQRGTGDHFSEIEEEGRLITSTVLLVIFDFFGIISGHIFRVEVIH